MMVCLFWSRKRSLRTRSRGNYSPPAGAEGAKRHSTYRSQFVVIEYRWHPLHGQRLRLVRGTGHRGRDSVHVEVGAGLSSELPAWMCSASTCSSMPLGSAAVSIAALNELLTVLTGLLPNQSRHRTMGLSSIEEAANATTVKHIAPAAHAEPATRKIGRASCRERV